MKSQFIVAQFSYQLASTKLESEHIREVSTE